MRFGHNAPSAWRRNIVVVWKLIRPYTDKVRLRIGRKLHGLDRRVSKQCGLGDAMHPVHDGPSRGEDDREIQVGGIDQPNVFYDRATGRGIAPATEPEWLVELTDTAQRNSNPRKVFGKLNQPVDVPGEETVFARPEMILLSHSACAGEKVERA